MWPGTAATATWLKGVFFVFGQNAPNLCNAFYNNDIQVSIILQRSRDTKLCCRTCQATMLGDKLYQNKLYFQQQQQQPKGKQTFLQSANFGLWQTQTVTRQEGPIGKDLNCGFTNPYSQLNICWQWFLSYPFACSSSNRWVAFGSLPYSAQHDFNQSCLLSVGKSCTQHGKKREKY